MGSEGVAGLFHSALILANCDHIECSKLNVSCKDFISLDQNDDQAICIYQGIIFSGMTTCLQYYHTF